MEKRKIIEQKSFWHRSAGLEDRICFDQQFLQKHGRLRKKLEYLGIEASQTDVQTSAQATASYLKMHH